MTALVVDEAVRVPVADGAALDSDIVIPERARGLIVFAHGSGSSRDGYA